MMVPESTSKGKGKQSKQFGKIWQNMANMVGADSVFRCLLFSDLQSQLSAKAPELEKVYDGLSAKAVIRSVISQAIHTKSMP